MEVLVARVLRDFRGLPHNSFAGKTSSHEKYLKYFSKFGFLTFLTTQSGDLFAGGGSSRKGTQRFLRLTLQLFHR